jgi:hypothetical protein
MIPTSIISSINSRRSGFSFYLNRELTSVLGPGIVLAVQVAYFVVRLRNPGTNVSLLSPLARLSGTVGFLIVIFVVAVGYIAGYVQREIAFSLLAQLERLSPIKKKLEESPYLLLENTFDQSLINEALQKHEYLTINKLRPLSTPTSTSVSGNQQASEVQDANNLQAAIAYESAGGGNVRSPAYNDFSFAKIWIRNYAPGFSIDFTELEINITTAALLPAATLAADIDVSFNFNGLLIGLTVIFLSLVWYVLLRSLFRLRRTERREAIRNLVLDYAMRCTAQRYPYKQVAVNEDQDE